jgi:hypothetical protein
MELSPMIKKLDEAIDRLRALPEERQQAATVLLLDFLDHDEDFNLSPEQIAEIEAALADDDVATDEEVEAFFARFRK